MSSTTELIGLDKVVARHVLRRSPRYPADKVQTGYVPSFGGAWPRIRYEVADGSRGTPLGTVRDWSAETYV